MMKAPEINLDFLLPLIEETFPLRGKRRGALPGEAAELSRLLTRARGERRRIYLNDPGALAAYLRYFLPWNIYRLGKILPALHISLSEGALILDLGAGPLTFASALWMYRPDLRNIPLTLRCVDISASALEAGRKLFLAIAGPDCPWKIHLSGSALNRNNPKKADLLSAVNLYNELYWDIPQRNERALRAFAQKTAASLDRLAAPGGSIFIMEPGVPRGGEFIAALRDAFLPSRDPLAPCPHREACPCPGGVDNRGIKNKWCHFAFDVREAPPDLRNLSIAAGLTKDRVTLSYLLAGPKAASAETAPNTGSLQATIISDPFPLKNIYGRYGCSALGLVLVAGSLETLAKLVPGTQAALRNDGKEERDPKSGALIYPPQQD